MTGEQLDALRSVDDETRWAVAKVYRAKKRAGELHHPCYFSSTLELARKRPDLTDDQIGAVVTAIIFWVAKDHQAWLRSE